MARPDVSSSETLIARPLKLARGRDLRTRAAFAGIAAEHEYVQAESNHAHGVSLARAGAQMRWLGAAAIDDAAIDGVINLIGAE